MATVAFVAADVALSTAAGVTFSPIVSATLLAGTATLGAFVDAAFVFPALTPDPPDVEGRRIEDLQLSSLAASEGEPINYSMGEKNRTGGTLLWVSDLEEQAVTEEIEVGKDVTQEVTNYKYFISLLIGLCEPGADSVTEVRANGNLIYANLIGGSAVSDLISCERFSLFGIDLFGFGAKHISPSGGPDLGELAAGALTTVTGYPLSVLLNNQILAPAILSGTELDGSSWILVANPLAADYANDGSDNGGNPFEISISQIALNFLPFRALDMKHLNGNAGQNPLTDFPLLLLVDAFRLSFDKALHPGYRGISSFGILRLWLEEWGNRLPRLSFIYKVDTSLPVSTAISRLLQRGGLSTDEFDVSAVSGTLKGYSLITAQSTIAALRPLMRAFNVVAYEADGKLIFINRGNESVTTIDEDDLAVVEGTTKPAIRPFTITDTPGFELPGEVNVQYLDTGLQLQRSSQRERRINAVAPTTLNIDLPIIMSANDARAIARRELWSAWTNRQVITLTLPPKYMHLTEHDRIVITTDGITYNAVVKKANIGQSFVIEIEALIEESVAVGGFESSPADDAPLSIEEPSFFPAYLIPFVMDIAPVSANQVNKYGFYIGGSPADTTAIWPGGDWYTSTDDETFTLAQSLGVQLNYGMTEAALGSGPVGYFDRKSTLTIEMKSGSLTTRTEFDVVNGANVLLIGDEIVAYTTATALGNNRYTISGLLRGLRNTESAIDSHSTNERVVVLSSLTFYEIDSDLIGETRYYKAVPANSDIDNASSVTHVVEANSAKPFGPAHLNGTRASGNLDLTWVYRTRDIISNHWFNAKATTVLDKPSGNERYQIDFWRGGATPTVVGLTVTVNDATTYQLTAAQMSANSIDPNTVQVDIYNMSALNTRGNRTRAIL